MGIPTAEMLIRSTILFLSSLVIFSAVTKSETDKDRVEYADTGVRLINVGIYPFIAKLPIDLFALPQNMKNLGNVIPPKPEYPDVEPPKAPAIEHHQSSRILGETISKIKSEATEI
eukprot:GDKJ01004585.1.p1 GENE.GDKJ01004585.1~~GDKJ01004585.1.p1  ORF type:complete len:116 (-),score=11.55 GDKJ01004585.1:498-845(-)